MHDHSEDVLAGLAEAAQHIALRALAARTQDLLAAVRLLRRALLQHADQRRDVLLGGGQLALDAAELLALLLVLAVALVQLAAQVGDHRAVLLLHLPLALLQALHLRGQDADALLFVEQPALHGNGLRGLGLGGLGLQHGVAVGAALGVAVHGRVLPRALHVRLAGVIEWLLLWLVLLLLWRLVLLLQLLKQLLVDDNLVVVLDQVRQRVHLYLEN